MEGVPCKRVVAIVDVMAKGDGNVGLLSVPVIKTKGHWLENPVCRCRSFG